jgi:hypothetical protein
MAQRAYVRMSANTARTSAYATLRATTNGRNTRG